MSNTLRLVLAILGACALAALATPELASKMPPGSTQIAAAVIAAALHRLNAQGPTDSPPAPEAP